MYQKITYIILLIFLISSCGKKEVENNTVTVRRLGSEKQEIFKKDELIKNILQANKLPLN